MYMYFNSYTPNFFFSYLHTTAALLPWKIDHGVVTLTFVLGAWNLQGQTERAGVHDPEGYISIPQLRPQPIRRQDLK